MLYQLKELGCCNFEKNMGVLQATNYNLDAALD